MPLPDPLPIPQADGPVTARAVLPGSKSYTNRALPIAALAQGTSTIRGVLDSDDTRYMVTALQDLGIGVEADWTRSVVTVTGCDGHIPASDVELYLGNSGTSMRFLTALVALGRGRYRLDGNDRMRQRPLQPLIDGLRALGVDARSEPGSGCPPVVVGTDGLPGGTVSMRGDLSSQYFSALAMVSPYATSPLTIAVEGDLVSKPYLDLTASTMRAFGVELHHRDYHQFWTEPEARYRACDYEVEPDASAASYFFALAAVTGGTVTVERLPWSSAQGDLRFVDILERMGCDVERGETSITATGPEQLAGVDVDMNEISDTVMTLAAIALFADGPVTIRNIGHIRHKETDRIAALATELGRLGISTEETEDSLTITPGMPRPTVIETYDDHRMAMSFAIAGARAPGIQIAAPGCVAKTVPEYWDILFPILGHRPPHR